MDTSNEADAPRCMGCGKPITGEPVRHASVLDLIIVAHDHQCCLDALEREVATYARGTRARTARWTHSLGYDTHQHDDLMRGVHD